MDPDPAIEAPAREVKEEQAPIGGHVSLLAELGAALKADPVAPPAEAAADAPVAPSTQPAEETTPVAPTLAAAATEPPQIAIEVPAAEAAGAPGGGAVVPAPAPTPAAAAAAAAAMAAAAAPPPAPTPAAAAAAPAAGGCSGGGGEEDELAASLLSNMAAWQSELDTFQSVLRRCMESTTPPIVPPPPPPVPVDSGGGSGTRGPRPLHSGPKGVTGFRGVTQHKRTRRFEANVWMDHKQMYLGAFDVPEQAAHAHDIGALCSGKGRPDTLNFPLSDYKALLPLLRSLPHSQVVAALRGFGRLPTARPLAGVSSGRQQSSAREGSSTARRRARSMDTDSDEEGAVVAPRPRPKRARKPPPSHADAVLPPLAPMDWQTVLQAPAGQQGRGVSPETPLPDAAAVAAATGAPASAAAAQQAELRALSAALAGGKQRPAPQPGGAPRRAAPAAPKPKLAGPPTPFETDLMALMQRSATLAQLGEAPNADRSGPKGYNGFKGVTLYKRCQRYNAHIWLGKQTHIGTFLTAAQAAVAHDVMQLWRSPSEEAAAAGLNFAPAAYASLLPQLRNLSEAEALAALRNLSRTPAVGGTVAAAAAAAASAGPAQVAAQPPRKRQRKPQAGAGAGNRSDSSGGGGGGGTVVRRRQGAGLLMWRVLDQERSGGEEEEEESDSEEASSEAGDGAEADADPDFVPRAEAAEEEEQAVRAPPARSGSPSPAQVPLDFKPCTTRSIPAALAAALQLPEDATVQGARPPRPGGAQRWSVPVSLRGQDATYSRLDRQRAAVAADIVLLWRRLAGAGGQDGLEAAAAPLNVPTAGYEQDTMLMAQLRRIASVPQMCQFLGVLVPQDANHVRGGGGGGGGGGGTAPSRAQAASAPGVLLGARKRKQQALLAEQRAAKQRQAAGGGSAGGACDGAAPGAALAEAATAVRQADVSDSASMLAALRALAVAGVGGALLGQVVAGWGGYPLLQQQDMFGSLRFPVANGDWEQLEDRLQVCLDLASLA